MAQTVCVLLGDAAKGRRTGIAGDRSCPHKHILRARIILLSSQRLCMQDVAGQAGVGRPAVWRRQQRFAGKGIDGLLRDKTRPPGIPPHTARTTAEVLALTCPEPSGEVTRWSGRANAARIGISLRCVGGSGSYTAFDRIGSVPSSARTTRPSSRRRRPGST